MTATGNMPAMNELEQMARDHLWLHFTRMGAYADGGMPIIVKLRMVTNPHSRAFLGHGARWINARVISATDPTSRRNPAARTGGTSRTSTRIAIHVVPQMRHNSA